MDSDEHPSKSIMIQPQVDPSTAASDQRSKGYVVVHYLPVQITDLLFDNVFLAPLIRIARV